MNVYDAAIQRMQVIFRDFDNVYVSFSGGKDSGVLLNLTLHYAKQIGRRISVFHIDYEAQYQMTTEYVKTTLDKFRNQVDVYHCCMPLAVPSCTSMSKSYWIPWDKGERDIWVRNLPDICVHEDNHEFDFFKYGMSDYEFQEKFSSWIHRKNDAKRTACLVGIRTQESLNRWRSLHSDNNYDAHGGFNWTRKMSDGVYNCYPIYDWTTEDIWTANGKFKWNYNKLYDLFYQAGVSVDQMRVASPFIEQGISSLKLYRVIEPNTWAKLIGRVNGVNFSGIYGGTTAMGWKSIVLPKGHSWKSYYEFLLSTLPSDTATNYSKKFETSVQFWRKRGGCLSRETIQKLKDRHIEFAIKSDTNYSTDKLPVTMEYQDDIDISEFKEIPTYKRMCVCIMKNDHLCKYMGFSLTKSETEIRRSAMERYDAKSGL